MCGAEENIKMHHVKKVADIKDKDIYSKYMKAINRKQIPLCESCHLLAHKGNWSNSPTPYFLPKK
jgi:hypothetical protein